MVFDIDCFKKLRNLYLQLKIIQNTKRAYIINYIENNPGVSVGVIVDFLKEPQAIVSQKLSQLRKAGLVSAEKKKTNKHYYVNNEQIETILKRSNQLLNKEPKKLKLKENFSEVSEAYTDLKVMLNSTRWNILEQLFKEGPVTQKTLLKQFHIKQPFMAQNLKLLHRQNYIIEEKRGRDKHYTVNFEKLEVVKKMLDAI